MQQCRPHLLGDAIATRGGLAASAATLDVARSRPTGLLDFALAESRLNFNPV